MLNDEQILALKERSEKHHDICWRGRDGQAHRITGVRLDWALAEGQSGAAPNWVTASAWSDTAIPQPVALLSNGKLLALRPVCERFEFPELDLSQFFVLTPWDGASTPTDKLTMLQDAARGGLDVNFMTGDVSLPKNTPLGPAAAR